MVHGHRNHTHHTPIRNRHPHPHPSGGSSTKLNFAKKVHKKVKSVFTVTGTGTGSKNKSYETRQGYKGMTESHTARIVHPSKRYTMQRELSFPSHYRTTNPYQQTSIQNGQNWRILRSYFSGVDLESLYSAADQITTTAANLVVPDRDSSSIGRLLCVDSVTVEVTVCNVTEGTIELDGYWVIARKDQTGGDTPDVDFTNGVIYDEQKGPSTRSFPFQKPEETNLFKTNWRVLGHHRVLLEEASYHRFHFSFAPHKLIDMTVPHVYDTIKGMTCYFMLGQRGLPVPGDQAPTVATDANVCISPSKVCIVENVHFQTRFPVSGAAQSIIQGSNLATQTHAYTKNEGSGVVEDMLGLATAALATQAVQ